VQSSNHPHDTASEVAAEEGEVLVDGPDGIAVALTPEAAEETGRRLLDAAREARSQTESAP
jgi:hypothetical protein